MTGPDSEKHWQSVYQSRATDAVSWYQKRPSTSLDLIAASGIARDAAIIDVGGGASVLVDHLLEGGFGDVTVLDVAPAALDAAKDRLGPNAVKVTWVATDIRTWNPDRIYTLWHDRAVFHFLTDRAARESYVATLKRALAPGGHVIIATFFLEGPEKCSGLPVVRYDAVSLSAELGEDFELMEERFEEHVTPSDVTQAFLWCRFRRTGA
jgi:2-polyprenyl-3-methyl-5-hydroxy-6-metoxy-1,4-benzoquinol methylase